MFAKPSVVPGLVVAVVALIHMAEGASKPLMRLFDDSPPPVVSLVRVKTLSHSCKMKYEA